MAKKKEQLEEQDALEAEDQATEQDAQDAAGETEAAATTQLIWTLVTSRIPFRLAGHHGANH